MVSDVRVGLLGTGRMGTAMGERIVGAGHALTVHNRTADRAGALLAAGAAWADSPAALVAASEVVLTVLTDDDAVESVYSGQDGLLAAAAGVVFVECSTIRARTVLGLDPRVRAAGARLVDAPLAGPPAAARAGALLVMAGGDPADLERVGPVLASYARRVAHLGPVGSGTTMKLALMAPMAAFFAALAESLAMGTRAGLDRAAMLDVFLDSHVTPPALRDRADLLLGAQRPAGFDIAGVRKDLRAIVMTAQDLGVTTGITGAAQALFAGAAAAGFAEQDLVYIVDYVTSVAGRGAGDAR